MPRFFRFCLSLAWLWLAGCAAQKTPHANSFWQTCEETVPAQPDGYQHFVCANRQGKQWEVLIKPAAR